MPAVYMHPLSPLPTLFTSVVPAIFHAPFLLHPPLYPLLWKLYVGPVPLLLSAPVRVLCHPGARSKMV